MASRTAPIQIHTSATLDRWLPGSAGMLNPAAATTAGPKQTMATKMSSGPPGR
jgi:hypothetical protein